MPYQEKIKDLHPFLQDLAGVWSNTGVPRRQDGLPYSFNVMPLPQERAEPGLDIRHDGYILKNFSYTEAIAFHGDPKQDDSGKTPISAPPAAAPNRGYKFRQLANALFYDQIIKFAEPAKRVGQTVHIENGAWLQLQKQPIAYGPYPTNPDPNPPTDRDFAKQISVPHGNSILAYGYYTGPHDGPPMIPSVSILPSIINPRGPFSADRFDHKLDQDPHYENPDPDLAKNPTRPLQELIAQLDVDQYQTVLFHTEMDSSGNKGFVTNIQFEEKMASAREYEAGYWLIKVKGKAKGRGHKKFEYFLAYYQNIILELVINGLHVRFPHVTSNIVKRQGPA